MDVIIHYTVIDHHHQSKKILLLFHVHIFFYNAYPGYTRVEIKICFFLGGGAHSAVCICACRHPWGREHPVPDPLKRATLMRKMWFNFIVGNPSSVRTVHLGLRYPCPHCDYKSTTASYLKKHIQAIHEGIKHPCDNCDFKASSQCSLNKHVEAFHSGIEFKCKDCDYITNTLQSLRLHQKKVRNLLSFKPRFLFKNIYFLEILNIT